MDQIDRKILTTLQANCRITNAELSRIVGLAPSTTLERVRRLYESKAILGYHARLDPLSLGLTVQALVSLSLTRHDVSCIEEFEKAVRDVPYVTACYHLTGQFDYLVHVAVRDLEHLGEYVKRHMAGLPHVGRAQTFVVLSEIKQDRGLTVDMDVEMEHKKSSESKGRPS